MCSVKFRHKLVKKLIRFLYLVLNWSIFEINSCLIRCVFLPRSGIPGNPRVFYTLMKGGTEQTNSKDTFYLNQYSEGGHTWAGIYVNYLLDYERIQQYNLTVRVEVCRILIIFFFVKFLNIFINAFTVQLWWIYLQFSHSHFKRNFNNLY